MKFNNNTAARRIRFTAWLLLLCLVLPVAVSCGGGGEETPTSAEAPTDVPEEETTGAEPIDERVEIVSCGRLKRDGDNLSLALECADPYLDLSADLVLGRNATWTLSEDRDGASPIDGKAVRLNEGENLYRVTVSYRTETHKIYHLKVKYRMAYTVSFYANSAQPITAQKLEPGQTAFEPVDPRRDGYRFLGWYLDGKKFDFSKAPESDCTLLAHWEKLDPKFYPSDTTAVTFTDHSASMHIVWKDYADIHEKRPASVTCVLTQSVGGAEAQYEILVTADGAEWKNPADSQALRGATVSQAESGAWSVAVKGLPEDCAFTLEQVPLTSDYTTLKNGTSTVNTIAGYVPGSSDTTAALTTRNGRLYDAAGNLIILKGVVTINVCATGFDSNTAETTLRRLSEIGVNCVRVSMQLIGKDGNGYVYHSNGSARTGDYNEKNAQKVTAAEKQKALKAVAATVNTATKLGMYVIIDWAILTSNPYQYLTQASEFFDTLSKQFADNPYLLYEICNEPGDASHSTTWGGTSGVKAYAEAIIDVIRGNGSDGVIIVAPKNSATALSEYTSSAKAGDDPIDDPLDDDRAYNVAYTFHCYPFNYLYDTYAPKLRDAHAAGLTVITTEMSPMDAGFDSHDALGFDMAEAAKYLRLYEEYDMGFCFFRFYSKNDYDENLMLQPKVDPLGQQWTRENLTECGKWFYDIVTGGGVFVNPDYSAVPLKEERPQFDNEYKVIGLANLFPGFATSGTKIAPKTNFFTVSKEDTLSDLLYSLYCKQVYTRASAVPADGKVYDTAGNVMIAAGVPASRETKMEIYYLYGGKKNYVTVSYGYNAQAGMWGITVELNY